VYSRTPVFIDTNIFLYARDASEPTKQAIALQLLEGLWRAGTGRTSVQALNEFYVNATGKLKPGLPADVAWEDVRALGEWNPQTIDVPLLAAARSVEARYGLSWWDSLMVAAAQAQGCELMLSEDLQHGARYDGVEVRNPFRLAVSEDVPAYATGTVSAGRVAHPRRGRPRKA